MKEDFNALRLKHHGDTAMMKKILQLECRYKTASKLPETLKNENFIFPSLAVAEMSTSDAIAEIHTAFIPEKARVLDMTCGFGIDTFHFAKKSSEVVTIEIDHESYLAAIHNTKALGLDNVNVVEADSIEWLKNNNKFFDVIFIDPARRDSKGRHFSLKDCCPDITIALPLLTSRCDRLIIKASPMADIEALKKELGTDCDIVVTGTAKECKELLLICDNKGNQGTISGVTTSGTTHTFNPSEEQTANAVTTPEYVLQNISATNGKGFLYEPFPAVMKCGGLKTLTKIYAVSKLHKHTHLYYSPIPIESFPGEEFKIIDIIPFSKNAIKDFSKSRPKINVSTRNFPLQAPELAKKLKIKEGGNEMVFGATAANDKKYLIVTSMGKSK